MVMAAGMAYEAAAVVCDAIGAIVKPYAEANNSDEIKHCILLPSNLLMSGPN